MTFQKRKDGESFEQMYKKFKRNFKRSGTLQEVKEHEHFTPPSDAKKEKRKRAQRATRSQQREDELS
ncbi:30S ribosomal protein S21 [Candidatus Marinamargulisbacteria bacterium SCGC AG-343-D04]|nr:30S ribosomal protein S21 [Candidatus Marinamargulisbacteria bacterium SCGC AG-343-D04]